ncbi:MAG: hypothetical protein AB1491_08715 [Thermodesulfobacteriota bacterium]
MAEAARKEDFSSRYGQAEKIWSGDSFIKYPDLRDLLAELPVSPAAVPAKEYGQIFDGNLDIVFGEVMGVLLAYEGYLKDKAFPIKECFIKPLFRPESTILEFNIRYKTKAGEEKIYACEVIRDGDSSFILFFDRYKPVW